MTPMIDVVFQLLIFFMTIPQVAALTQEPLELPKLKGTEDQQQLTLTINVTEAGDLRMGGQPITIAGLVSYLTDELARVGGDASRLTVVVRADERGESRARERSRDGAFQAGNPHDSHRRGGLGVKRTVFKD